MIKVIDGTNARMGRLSSYVAKELLKGEEIAIVNSEKVIITGGEKNIVSEFLEKRGRVGTLQKGPKYSKTSEKMIKRCIRGMLPNPQSGRGKDALRRVKCYVGIPKELESAKKVSIEKEKSKISKFMKLKELSKR